MEYVSCIFIEFFDCQIMTPFDSRTLNVDTLDLAMCMRPFAVFVLRVLNPTLRLRHTDILRITRCFHDTCWHACLRTTHKPMMSRQDGTFLPRVLRFDWSVVNQLLLASSPIQLVKIESLGCPSTVNFQVPSRLKTCQVRINPPFCPVSVHVPVWHRY